MCSSILASSPTPDHPFAAFSMTCFVVSNGITDRAISSGRKKKVFYKPIAKHLNVFVFFFREQVDVSSSKKIRYVT